jgi:hypothetical protein
MTVVTLTVLADEISRLTSDQVWELATLLHEHHSVTANLLKADLDIVDYLSPYTL